VLWLVALAVPSLLAQSKAETVEEVSAAPSVSLLAEWWNPEYEAFGFDPDSTFPEGRNAGVGQAFFRLISRPELRFVFDCRPGMGRLRAIEYDDERGSGRHARAARLHVLRQRRPKESLSPSTAGRDDPDGSS
jgi:hypothetical protein